jgi:hypothetical protein
MFSTLRKKIGNFKDMESGEGIPTTVQSDTSRNGERAIHIPQEHELPPNSSHALIKISTRSLRINNVLSHKCMKIKYQSSWGTGNFRDMKNLEGQGITASNFQLI